MTAAVKNQETLLIDQAVAAASEVASFWAASSATVRAGLLNGLADALEKNRDALIAIANQESGLGEVRLQGEVARTAYQLRGFAAEVLAGVPYREVDDAAVAGTPPVGRPRLTRVQVPLGPVAMFSASNFPFAFSVLGGDTASALAAGCPVIVKSHSGHPELSKAVFDVARGVLSAQGLPKGVLNLVEGASRVAGTYLVEHPDVAAVAFTGSFQGGAALRKAANERPRPVPFFGELGSINPLVALPSALARDGEALAKTLAGSITMGCGQFCTRPSVIIVFETAESDAFLATVARELESIKPHRMLTSGIRDGFDEGVATMAGHPSVRVLVSAKAGDGPAPQLLEVDAQAFLSDRHLREELFGPAAVVLRVSSVEQIEAIFEAIGGSLTATLWGLDEPSAENRRLIAAAEKLAGRVLFSGVPTGVAVTHAQQHGGPWPSSTLPQTTSVGFAALERFLRPVALQDIPNWVHAEKHALKG